MNAEVEAYYETICPNPHGANSEDQVTVIDCRVKMKDCKKCRWHREFNIEKLKVHCSFKGRRI